VAEELVNQVEKEVEEEEKAQERNNDSIYEPGISE